MRYFFPWQPNFFARPARKFCQELATLINFQTGRRNTLDFDAESTSYPTSRGDKNCHIAITNNVPVVYMVLCVVVLKGANP